MKTFDVRLVEKQSHKFIEVVGNKDLIECEKDVVALIGMCAEYEADRILLHGNILPKSFFDLKSGQAGMMLQKLVNYQIRTAAVFSPDQIRGKFGEFVVEANRGHHFRVFFDRQDAESWLLSA
jgi:PadR family transcriptional regulator, regulatory protein AphA